MVDSDRVSALVETLRQRAAGRANALTARQLEAYGFTDRELRCLAHAANERGDLVCADGRGYFVPATAEEVDEMVRRLQSQAMQMLDRSRQIRRLATRQFKLSDQPTLGFLESRA